MKLLKMKLNKEWLLPVLIFVFAIIVRFYNFPNRVTFWSEQARSLIVSADYLTKPSLLGQEYFIRQDTNAHVLFAGAYFNYSLVPLILLLNYDPIAITVFFTILNLFTGLVIYFVAKKIFNGTVALISTLLFLFNDWMIYHSLFIWSYNYLPLVGIFILYFFWRFVKKQKVKDVFILGLLNGLGVSLQFLFLPIATALFILSILKSKNKSVDPAVFIFGMVVGNLPMVIFDLRHAFYETTTLIRYFLETLSGKSNATFAYYYLLPFWPVAAIAGGIIIFWLWKKSKFFAVLVLILYLFLNLNSTRINWKSPTGMPNGITTAEIDRASKLVAEDAKADFNVSELLDFDKRAYVLRYFVGYKYGKKPLPETNYQDLKQLYVLSGKGYNFEKSGVWEIDSGGPYHVGLLTNVDTDYAIYKLTK